MLELSRAATITWAHDVAGDAAASATFKAPAHTLVIDSVAEPELEIEQWQGFDIAASAIDSRAASFVTSSD